MNKNASNLYPFLILDQLGQGITGLTPSVYLRQDSGSFAAATNSVTEVSAANEPGLYQLTLTQTECNCDVLTIKVTLPDGQEPAILDVVYPVTTGGATPAEIWAYAGGRTVTNTIPTASDNATAVWETQTKIVTINSTQAATLATAAALATVGDNVAAVKAKTDNLPANPAATGDAMTLTSAYDAAKTASQFNAGTDAVTIDSASVQAVQSGLSTFNPSTDAVTIATAQASTLATAAAQATQTAALETLAASILRWTATASTLTLYDNAGNAIANYALTRDSSGNITAIAPEEEGN